MNRKLVTLRHGGQSPPVIWVGAKPPHPPLYIHRAEPRTSDHVFLPAHRPDDHQVCPSSLQLDKRRHRPNPPSGAEVAAAWDRWRAATRL
jgi:hypothetical protein